jgi:ssDNA-binding Zn-finger/Zn-ribbon topoisomerase 1
MKCPVCGKDLVSKNEKQLKCGCSTYPDEIEAELERICEEMRLGGADDPT